MTVTPYRTPGLPAGAKVKPAELVYRTRDPERLVASARAAAQAAIAGAIVAAIVATTGYHDLAIVLFVATGVFSAWRWRRAPDAGEVVLRIDGHVLVVIASP